jgi:hypothetical protein
MRFKPGTAIWMGVAFCAALGVAGVVLGLRGAGVRGTTLALDMTARLSFLLFWPAYAGGALAALSGPVFLPLKRAGRDLGLAFAAAHLVHVGLVAWLCWIGAAPDRGTFVFFGSALGWVYLLALFSFDPPRRALDPRLWRAMRFIGMNGILYAFATDFLARPLHGDARHVLGYLPFVALCAAGPPLRLAAWARRHGWGLSAMHRVQNN